MPIDLSAVSGSRVSKRVRKPVLSSTARRHGLAQEISDQGGIMPFPCSRCSKKHLVCKVGLHSARCSECLSANTEGCDMGLSPGDLKKIAARKERLQQELEAAEEASWAAQEVSITAQAKVRRLRKQLAQEDSRYLATWEKEVALIKQLEALEEAEDAERLAEAGEEARNRQATDLASVGEGSSGPPLSDFALDPSLLEDFEWSPIGAEVVSDQAEK